MINGLLGWRLFETGGVSIVFGGADRIGVKIEDDECILNCVFELVSFCTGCSIVTGGKLVSKYGSIYPVVKIPFVDVGII